MARTPAELTGSEIEFLSERHVGTLTTVRVDGKPHVVAIAFGYDHGSSMVRIITSDRTQKVINVESNDMAVVCQVDARRWLAMEGRARVRREPEAVDEAVSAFEARYRPVRENPHRVAIEIVVDLVLGRA
jgi:PPOX class probable F420-dependent enzyme